MNNKLQYLLGGAALMYSQGCQPTVVEAPRPAPTPIVCEPSLDMIDFSATTLNEEEVGLEDYVCDGSLIVLNFWETWCGPCRAEMPYLAQFARDYERDVTVLGLTRDQNGDTTDYVANPEFEGINYLITTQDTFSAYGITAIPTSFLLDEKGEMVMSHRGAMAFEETDDIVQVVDYLLGQE